MANQIRLKRASGSDPGASDLVTGEVAIRTDTGKIFTKKDDNSVVELGVGISNVVEDTSPQLGGDLQSNGNDIDFADNDKAIFGTGGDLELVHDGSNSIIKGNTGETRIQCANTFKLTNSDNTETHIKATLNGDVELFFDNARKLETTSDGIDITGSITLSGFVDGRNIENDGIKLDGIESGATADQSASEIVALIADQTIAPSTIDMEDNEKIKLGAGDDLEIYHNGSHSIIDNTGTGDLKLIGDDVIIQASNDETMAKFIEDGAVELYHNGTKKLETDSAGTIFSDDIFFADSLKVNLGNSSDLQLFHNGSNSQITNITGHLLIGGERIKLTNPSAGHVYLDATLSGSVDIYHNNSKKFETTSSGVSVTGGVTASGASTFNEDVTFTGTNVNIVFDKTADAFEFADNAEARFGNSDDFRIIHDGTYNNLKGTGAHGMRFFTNNTERMRLTSAGVLQPAANATYDLGTSSLRWNNLFVNDMHFANSPDNPNKVDGTWGDWTLQEGEDTIYMLNNRNGKKYKMNLTEV